MTALTSPSFVSQDGAPASRWFHRLLVNRALGWVLIVPFALMIVITAWQYAGIEARQRAGLGPDASLLIANGDAAKQRVLNDYEDFYIVGRMYWEGDVLPAYKNETLQAAQRRFTGIDNFMPWAYPPQMTALAPLLPLVGMGWSFFLFMGGSLALYFHVLRRIDARYVGAALLAVYPAMMLNTRLGQNGFLTGALIGMVLLGIRARKDSAGVPLGLMLIKPHMGVAIGILTLLEQRWRMLAIGVGVVVVTSLAATAMLGFAIWPAFLGSVQEVSGFVKLGLFPLYRMSSVYAAARSFGVSSDLSFALHIAVAVIALGTLVLAAIRKWPMNRVLALTALCSVAVSPYNYDYDFGCLAVGLCLVLPELLERIRFPELVLFYLFCWIGSGSGLFQHFRASLFMGTIEHPIGTSLNWSFHAVGVIAATILIALVLRRGDREAAALQP